MVHITRQSVFAFPLRGLRPGGRWHLSWARCSFEPSPAGEPSHPGGGTWGKPGWNNPKMWENDGKWLGNPGFCSLDLMFMQIQHEILGMGVLLDLYRNM